MYQSKNKIAFFASAVVVGTSFLFFLYEFFLRVAPSAMMHELMRDFNASASGVGFMSSCFFFAYAPMQIPVGLLCDRYGPRIWLIVAALCCSVATMIFSVTESLYVASLARFFIGMASAFGFVGPLVMATRWFEEKYLTVISGLLQVVGCVGAIFAGSPISVLIDSYGWRTTLWYSGLIGIVLAFIFFVVLKNQPKNMPKIDNSNKNLMPQLKRVIKNPHTIWISIVAFSCWTPISVFAELWGTSFLITVYNASKLQATQATTWIWVGMAFGSLVAGFWSNKINSRKKPIMILNLIGFVASCLVIFAGFNDWFFVDVFLFLLGVSSGIQPITFGLACELNRPDVHGAAMGFNNMAVIAGGVLVQPLVGWLLDLFWDHKMFDGAPVYQVMQYKYVFLMIPCSYIISAIITRYKIQETYCKASY